jgi:hypothetical protein
VTATLQLSVYTVTLEPSAKPIVTFSKGYFRTTYYASTLANPTGGLYIGSGMPDVTAKEMQQVQAWLFHNLHGSTNF